MPIMGIERSGNETNAALAAVLDRIREEQNLTYAELIKRTGLPRRTIGRIFHDERKMDVDQLAKSCNALGVTVSYVWEEAIKLLQQHR